VMATDSIWQQVLDPSVAGLYVLPSIARELVRWPGDEVDHIKMVMLTGAKTSSSVLAALSGRFPNASVVSLYGATEGGQAQVMMVYEATTPSGLGRPVGRTEVRLRNTRVEEGIGVVGEICLRREGSPIRSYVGGDDADVFLSDGWTATGDLGLFDSDGVLHLFDRIKDVIIRGGENISAVELEEAIEELAAVREAAVVGAPSRSEDEDIIVFVVPENRETGVDVAAVRRDLGARLPRSRVPRRVLVVERLPRNAMGKIDKEELRGRLARPGGG